MVLRCEGGEFLLRVVVPPAEQFAFKIVAALGPSLTNAMVAVGVTFSPSIARLMRGQVLATKNHLYVEAAEQYGRNGSDDGENDQGGNPRMV